MPYLPLAIRYSLLAVIVVPPPFVVEKSCRKLRLELLSFRCVHVICLFATEVKLKVMKNLTPTSFNGIAGAVRWGKRVFLACGHEGIKVFELNGDKAELVAHVTDFPAFDLVLRDGCLAVAAGKHGVVLLDAQTLKPLRVLATTFPVHSIVWDSDHLTAHATSVGNNQSHKFLSP